MAVSPPPTAEADDSPGEVVVAVRGGAAALRAVRFAGKLADALDSPWHAVHVETPLADGEDPSRAAEALALAASLGASVATIPAATVADGVAEHLEGLPAGQLVLGRPARPRRYPWRRTIVEELERRRRDLVIHLVPPDPDAPAARRRTPIRQAPLLSHALAAASVAVTLAVALLLYELAGIRSLSLLFLFPVIAAAARLGVAPALLAALLSVAAFNYFFLQPPYVLKPDALQSLVMATVLALVAIYTAFLTSTLRGRVALSDRSARENASVAAFALQLTRVADWTSTAETVCQQVGAMLEVNVVIFREVGGRLELAGAAPAGAELGPLDRAALDWAWSHGVEAGRDTSNLSAADWRFHPLKTSLGMLAVLGLARDDGGSPVPADRNVLLSTLIAQAALAHERLRLEDMMRRGQGGSPPRPGAP